MAGVAVWRMLRHPEDDPEAFRSAARLGAATVLAGALFVVVSGDAMSRVMTDQQPMKMASAEALFDTSQPASFSIFTIGTLDGSEEVFSIRIPYLLSFLARGTLDGEVEGINDLQAFYEEQFGPGDYVPNVPVAYWSFRLMIGVGTLAGMVALWFLWAMRRGRGLRPNRFMVVAAITLPLMPLAANSLGWIFTEMGRQPWIVWGLMPTATAVSPSTTLLEVGITLLTFTLLYGGLAVIEVGLLARSIGHGLPKVAAPDESDGGDTDAAAAEAAFVY
jgi:cytochrome d ubiquinol oxidase subunit I